MVDVGLAPGTVMRMWETLSAHRYVHPADAICSIVEDRRTVCLVRLFGLVEWLQHYVFYLSYRSCWLTIYVSVMLGVCVCSRYRAAKKTRRGVRRRSSMGNLGKPWPYSQEARHQSRERELFCMQKTTWVISIAECCIYT